MNKEDKILVSAGTSEESTGITEIAAKYLNQIGGAFGGTFSEFMQYTQSAGQTGGPATGGGAFWQQVMRYRRLTTEES